MTLDIYRLKELHKFISKRIIKAGIRKDKPAYNKWIKRYRKVNEYIDKYILKELQKVY